MHQALGPEVLRPSPNSVVLDRLGLLEPQALDYIHKQASRVGRSPGSNLVFSLQVHAPATRPAQLPVHKRHKLGLQPRIGKPAAAVCWGLFPPAF
jgi:hypothetical protein